MTISLENVGKRYNRHWIFRHLTHTFKPSSSHVILGSNGSGKSTLLQLIAGFSTPSEGSVNYRNDSGATLTENIYKSVSISAPYQELIEEFTLEELLTFQQKFKPFVAEVNKEEIQAIVHLEEAAKRPIKQYSSGMKQRVRLALALLAETPILLLDEPTSNLDKKGITWYQNMIEKYTKNRLVIVCSNQQEYEYEFCDEQIEIEQYKTN